MSDHGNKPRVNTNIYETDGGAFEWQITLQGATFTFQDAQAQAQAAYEAVLKAYADHKTLQQEERERAIADGRIS